MTFRDGMMLAAAIAAVVLLGTLGYLLDQWILTSSLPVWLKVLLLRSGG